MKLLLKTFSAFVVVGGFCTLLQYVILILLVQFARVDPAVASTVGFLVSAGANYLLNHQYTFRSVRPHLLALPRFIAIATVGVGLNWVILRTGTGTLGVHYLAVQLGATAIVLFWNFLANRKWSF